jgi:LysR family transcriptional regulator, regulator of abg operon
MRFNQIAALAAVVEAGGIRAGARKLNISQAAVTRSLRELEQEVGTALVIRSARGVSLTGHGERIYERASVMVAQMQRLKEDVDVIRDRGDNQITFNVGNVIAVTILPEVLKQFMRLNPDKRAIIGEGTFESSVNKLRNGTIDFVLVFNSRRDFGPEFTVIPILTAGMKVALRKGHPAENARSLADLLNEHWILTPDDEMENGRPHHIFSEHRLPTPSKVTLTLSSAVGVSLSCEGSAVASMAEPYLRIDHIKNRMRVLDLKETLSPITYSVIHRSDIPLSNPALAIIKMFHRSFPQWGWRRVTR